MKHIHIVLLNHSSCFLCGFAHTLLIWFHLLAFLGHFFISDPFLRLGLNCLKGKQSGQFEDSTVLAPEKSSSEGVCQWRLNSRRSHLKTARTLLWLANWGILNIYEYAKRLVFCWNSWKISKTFIVGLVDKDSLNRAKFHLPISENGSPDAHPFTSFFLD